MEIRKTSNIGNLDLNGEIYNKKIELLQNYILPHFAHFNEEG